MNDCFDLDRDIICAQPKNPGTCKRFSSKWYFDATDGECKMFGYGGCSGNKNRFKTKELCTKTCRKF